MIMDSHIFLGLFSEIIVASKMFIQHLLKNFSLKMENIVEEFVIKLLHHSLNINSS